MGRGKVILYLTGISWLALFLFAITPAPWNIVFMFINGFPLGMIWGIVFSYVEGRMTTDFIGAALSVSFIFSSGFVKSVAEYIRLHFNVTELWVPFYTGLAFAMPLMICVIFLEKIPPPSEEDMISRSKRHADVQGRQEKICKDIFSGTGCCHQRIRFFHHVQGPQG